MKRKNIKNMNGQSILEITIALALFAGLAVSLVVLALSGFSSLVRSRDIARAGALAQEGIEAVRSIRDRDWSEFAYDRSGVEISGSSWVFMGEDTTETIGAFTRTIDFYPVYRNVSGQIVAAEDPGASADASSTKVTVGVSWEIRPGTDETVERTTYFRAR